MTLNQMIDLFSEEPDFLEFAKVANKRSRRRDMHAFMLLDELVPGDWRIVSAAEHDQIWLDIDAEALAAVITPEQVVELRRCGLFFCRDSESLSMFA